VAGGGRWPICMAVGGPTLSYKSIISSPMRENVAWPPGHAGTICIGNSPRSHYHSVMRDDRLFLVLLAAAGTFTVVAVSVLLLKF
jgi:hypothetical protein